MAEIRHCNSTGNVGTAEGSEDPKKKQASLEAIRRRVLSSGANSRLWRGNLKVTSSLGESLNYVLLIFVMSMITSMCLCFPMTLFELGGSLLLFYILFFF